MAEAEILTNVRGLLQYYRRAKYSDNWEYEQRGLRIRVVSTTNSARATAAGVYFMLAAVVSIRAPSHSYYSSSSTVNRTFTRTQGYHLSGVRILY